MGKAATLFIYLYVSRADIQYVYAFTTRSVTLLLSSLLPLGREPPLG